MTTLTPNLGLAKPDVGTVNWDAIINSNFDIIDGAMSGAAFSGVAGEIIQDGDPVWFDATNGSVWKASNTVPNRDCIGVATISAAINEPIAFITSGLKSSIGWAWTPGEKIFLGNGQLVSEVGPLRIGDLGVEMVVQRVGIALSGSLMLVNPDRAWRTKSYIIPSIDSMHSSGGTLIVPTIVNIAASHHERVFAIPSDATTRTFVYTFLLPPAFKEFAEISAWACRVGYNVATNRTIQFTNVQSGPVNAMLTPTAGSSNVWADHSLAMSEINAVAFTKGSTFHLEVTSAASGAAAANLSAQARLRFVPDNGTY